MLQHFVCKIKIVTVSWSRCKGTTLGFFCIAAEKCYWKPSCVVCANAGAKFSDKACASIAYFILKLPNIQGLSPRWRSNVCRWCGSWIL
uniref:Uncharacterized protein n=1 Tax=Ixodes ricinus TaxID=34613 RepID=A0A147BJX1_IXORI